MSKDFTQKQDMSIEQILTSIRKVIDSQEINQANNDDVLELTDIVGNGSTVSSDCVTIAHQKSNLNFADDALEQENGKCTLNNFTLSDKLEEKILSSPLISEKSVTNTTNTLKYFLDVEKEANANLPNPKAKTLEELVIEIIKPQLSQWLDKNLPILVKQLVEKEIQKLLPQDQKNP
jgi:cell pole-organizing protein PopZ